MSLLKWFLSLFGSTSAPPSPKRRGEPPRVAAPRAVAEKRRVIRLTDDVVREIKKILQDQPHRYLRIAVRAGGGAFQYQMAFDDEANPDQDLLDEFDGLEILIDRKSELFIKGMTIYFVDDPSGRRGFAFDNPNAVSPPADWNG